MLINLSNHHSDKWISEHQVEAINKFSNITDLPFPNILPDEDEKYINELAKSYKIKCFEIFAAASEKENNAVHIMGEFTFTFALVNLLMSEGIKCVASTTKRIVKELDNNKNEVTFEFVRFREYMTL